MEFGIDILILFFFIAIAAAFVDAIAGGGGLIVIPALLAVGIPPAIALATNKVGSVGGAFSAALHFISIKEVSLEKASKLVVMTFIGAILGGMLLTRIDNAILKDIVPILLIAFAIYFIAFPGIGKFSSKELISPGLFAFTVAPVLGFYDGFFGPGTGAFMAISFVLLLGFNLLKATAHAKVLNFSSSLAALLFFLIYGEIYWDIGLVMLAGQLIGGKMGAKLVVQSGQKLIRIVIVVVSLAVSIKMFLFQ